MSYFNFFQRFKINLFQVIDFGTARKFEQGKRMTKRLGTPYYIGKL